MPVAGCSAPGPFAATRGDACGQPGQAAADASGAILLCLDKAGGETGAAPAYVWGVPGLDRPITARAAENRKCPQTGALGVADDGMVLVCKTARPGPPPAGAAGEGK